MAKYARYYTDNTAAVEYTNYVELEVLECTHTTARDLEILKGNAGANGCRDDVRYDQQWVIVARVSRRVQDCLRGWVKVAFTNAQLRVYDEYSADFYTDYTSVKLKHLSTKTIDGGQSYTVTLTVVK